MKTKHVMLIVAILALLSVLATIFGFASKVAVWGAFWDIGFIVMAACYFQSRRTFGGTKAFILSYVALDFALFSLLHHLVLGDRGMMWVIVKLGGFIVPDTQVHAAMLAFGWRISYGVVTVLLVVGLAFGTLIIFCLVQAFQETRKWLINNSIPQLVRNRIQEIITS